MTDHDDLPLAGVRVVDLTANMSRPLATMLLADQGADVIKVEPPEGDALRWVGTSSGSSSTYFVNLDRNKRSIVLDLASADGRAAALRLAAGADVFVQNYRHGVAARLGLGPDKVRAVNPRIIYLAVTGYGTIGPRAGGPAYDHVI